jgi:hypothetical protein
LCGYLLVCRSKSTSSNSRRTASTLQQQVRDRGRVSPTNHHDNLLMPVIRMSRERNRSCHIPCRFRPGYDAMSISVAQQPTVSRCVPIGSLPQVARMSAFTTAAPCRRVRYVSCIRSLSRDHHTVIWRHGWMGRSEVTVTRLLCDPLPMQNVLKYRTRDKAGAAFHLSFQYKMYHIIPPAFFPRAVLRVEL